MAAGTVDLVVATIPQKGDVTLPLAPAGKVDLKRDATVTRIRIELERLALPSAAGPAFNTYIAWAVSPEGSFENLGEIGIDKDKGRLEATTRFEQVGILITAEPHYMVDRPSAAVSFRTMSSKNDDVRRMTVSLGVGTYDYSVLQISSQPGLPALVRESRAAFQIAKNAEAERWAESEFRRARVALDTMEEMVSRSSPIDIVSQSANEVIRRSQQAVAAARERQAAMALESARNEISVLKQDMQNLESRVRQLTDQQAVANGQIQKLQSELATASSDNRRAAQERDAAVTRERTIERQLADLQKRDEDLRTRLVLPLQDEFYDLKAAALTPAGRDALARLSGIADAVSGQIYLQGPAPDAVFEAARQFLIQAGINVDRIILKR